MDQDTDKISLHEVAAVWYLRVSAEQATAETRAALETWLAGSPDHRAAFEAINRTWSQLKAATHDPQILELRHEAALRLSRKTSQVVRPLRWAAVALIFLTIGTALAFMIPGVGADRSPIAWLAGRWHARDDGRYVTKTGERLSIALEDGSQVTLNTQTELRVAYTSATRSVQLVRGQAFFEVAKNALRPFVVEAQDRRFVAVGTAFDVRIAGDEVEITMLAGTVRAEGPGAGSPMVTTIRAGEQLTTGPRAQGRVYPTDPERVISWQRGQVIFDNTRLGDAIDEINRYSETRIALADAGLADLRLSGSFATGNTNVFVEAITRYFPIQIEHEDSRAIVLGAQR
jgi:transmembrane sensor